MFSLHCNWTPGGPDERGRALLDSCLLRRTVPAHVAGLALAKLTVAVGMLSLAELGATFDAAAGTVDTGTVAIPAREALSWARGVSGLDQLLARFV